MKQTINLTDAELGMIDMVISQFISEKKPTPRRQLVVQFQEPGLLETLVNRSILRDVNRQIFFPTLLAFEFCSDKEVLAFAKESVATVLHAMKTLFLKHEEDRMFTGEEIAAQAQLLGRVVHPNTVWLGLYFAEEFSALGGWAPSDNPTVKTSVRVSEYILQQKNIDNAWDNLVKQRIQWQVQRESFNPATSLRELGDDADTVDIAIDQTMKETGLLLFISHSSKDSGIALGLIELLRAALTLKDEQIRCTSIDGFRLSAGANVDDDLKAEVLAAKTFIGLITPNSLGSAYVLFELGARWGARRPMVPVLAGLTPDALQGPLKAINAISANNVNQLHQLVSDLADALDLDVQRAATYTRYAEKLTRQIEDTFGIHHSNREPRW